MHIAIAIFIYSHENEKHNCRMNERQQATITEMLIEKKNVNENDGIHSKTENILLFVSLRQLQA